MLTQPPQQAKAHISKTVIARAGASTVRPLSAADLAKVALLFRQKFRPRASAPLAEIEFYFRDVFCDGPACDPACPSLVYVGGDGEVSGFLGSLSQPMALQGRPVRATHACALMAPEPSVDPWATPRL